MLVNDTGIIGENGLFQKLRTNGYQTAAFGKVSNNQKNWARNEDIGIQYMSLPEDTNAYDHCTSFC